MGNSLRSLVGGFVLGTDLPASFTEIAIRDAKSAKSNPYTIGNQGLIEVTKEGKINKVDLASMYFGAGIGAFLSLATMGIPWALTGIYDSSRAAYYYGKNHAEKQQRAELEKRLNN